MEHSHPLPEPVRVDFVSDVVCPWCVIGYRQLVRARERTGVRLQIHWHPYELNPDMPPEGQNLREHLEQKYGTTDKESEAARARLTALGESLGFRFRFDGESRIVNTFLAHQLVEWADGQGRQNEVKLALFKAHFTDRRDVSDIATLARVASETGLDGNAARAALESGQMAWNVRGMEKFWIGKGVRGVPAMVFAQKHLLTGAQGEDTYADMLRRLGTPLA